MGQDLKERFTSFSPTDYRYPVEDLKGYLTEEAFIRYKTRVEAALVKVLARKGLISWEVASEIVQAADQISAEEVYEEERRIRHDIRALVNCIRNRVSDKAKPYVHLFATSYDIVDTANVLRYKDAIHKVILPSMIELEKIWMGLSLRHKDTLQIGRTHGQHAEPITFGFAIALYVDRWGNRILRLKEATWNLVGKFSGAVGAYNSSSLFFDSPEEFEKAVMQELELKPANISTQILPPEPMVDLFHTIISGFGVLANFADDMRHLQRSEIAEVSEEFEEEQVGSSTMPHKRNPINFENIKGMWKAFMPKMITVYMDQISEHQRDLTNSCSQRYLPELLVVFTESVRRMIKVSKGIKIEEGNMQRNFEMSKDEIAAEPLYILLASLGYPNPHEYVRSSVFESFKKGKPLSEILMEDETLKPYLERFTDLQKGIIQDPSRYIGIAPKKVKGIIDLWEKRLKEWKGI